MKSLEEKTTLNRLGWAGGSGYAGLPVERLLAEETNHNKLNENLGLTDDPPTKACSSLWDEVLKK